MQELLKSTFGDCKFAVSSLCGSKSSYENISENEFYIYDPPNEENRPIRVLKIKGDAQLTVYNFNENEICIVKTDKCLFPNEHSKCDCILFNNDKFFLVEIKTSKTSARSAQRHKAVEQLGATLEILTQNGITLHDFEARAVICFRTENEHPIQASRNTQRAIFFEKYKVWLDEGNKIEF